MMETEGNGSNGGKRAMRPCPCPWQQTTASRIVRVSRASGGKDRHSKVYTAKGLRDRRVRLSVSTAIQFYDLQDRLGYDQPSKAIEWLIKAAGPAIDELPSLDSSAFTPPAAAKIETSSNSDNSRCSELSLSRPENRAENLGSFTDLLTGTDAGRVQTATADYFGSEQFASAFLQQEHFFPAGGGGDHYNLNFSIAPGLAGFHRGTLQSNSPPPHHHHHNHQQFLFPGSTGLDESLQLCHGYKNMEELKGKGKG